MGRYLYHAWHANPIKWGGYTENHLLIIFTYYWCSIFSLVYNSKLISSYENRPDCQRQEKASQVLGLCAGNFIF